ncbi:MAG: MFS transporter [Halobacteriota archaeon]
MSRWNVFGSLCSMVFLVNLARVVFAPLLQPVAADFGVTAASLGIIASAAWLGSALPRLPTGYVLTKVPRHYVVIATGSLLVVTAAATGLAGSTTHLAVGAFLMGLSSGMYFIAANPLISELFPGRVGRALGIHGMSSQIAAVVAPLVVAAVLLVTDWRATFFLISLAALLITAVLIVATRRTDLPNAGIDDRSLLQGGRVHWRLILTGIAVMGVVGFLWNGLFNLYGDYLEVAKSVDPETGRLLLSAMFAAGVPAFFISGRLADRVNKIPLLLTISLGFGVAVLGLTVADGLASIVVWSVLAGYLFFSLIPVVDTYLLSSLPDRHRGSAYTWYSSTMMIIQAFGSGAIGTAVARGLGYDQAFVALSLLVGVVAVGLFVLYGLGLVPAGRARIGESSADGRP